MTEEPSARLIGQRVRNRIYEILEILADCDVGVDLVGISGYLDLFDDFIHRPSNESRMSVLSKDERAIGAGNRPSSRSCLRGYPRFHEGRVRRKRLAAADCTESNGRTDAVPATRAVFGGVR
ncbi:hypothetical protein [Mesorhizobium sp. M1322]|uniref:hypothetical protein n=1 Tax=Mesorhizobium sp. M1322 TaxID=2957081 RepID=UPI00333C96C8